MSNCPKCNTLLPDGSTFCSACGTNLSAAPMQAPAHDAHARKLHCPNCKSHNISISTESSVNSAVSTHHGRVSSTHVSNTHRNFWFCSDCGTKFRNIQNLEEEIKKTKNSPIIYGVLAVIAVVIFVYLLSKVMGDMFGFMLMPYTVAAALAALIFLIGVFSNKSKLKKLKSELEYLKINCFD